MKTQEIIQTICSRLEMDQSQYNALMYEIGEEYFQLKCNGFEEALEAFRKSREMWHWWKIQYLMLDEQLVLHKVGFNLDLYRAHHIGLEYWPNKAIVQKALFDYEKIVQDIIKTSKMIKC